jgi:hypothetical protein
MVTGDMTHEGGCHGNPVIKNVQGHQLLLSYYAPKARSESGLAPAVCLRK